jgi:hypothetical protein
MGVINQLITGKGTPLVGGIPTPLKNMSSSVGMIIPNLWKNKKMFQTTNQTFQRIVSLGGSFMD